MIEASAEDQSNGDGPKKLTDRQIVTFSITFLLAGYDTTGNALTFTSYLLAMNTDVQEKLQAEIDDYFEENPVGKVHTIMCLKHASIFFPCLSNRKLICMKQHRRSNTWIWSCVNL